MRDEFVRLLVEKTKKIKIGNPLEKDVWLGPVINEGAVKTFEDAVARAVKDGGTRPDRRQAAHRREPFNHGYFVEPTVIDGVPAGSPGVPGGATSSRSPSVADVVVARRGDRAREPLRVRPDRRASSRRTTSEIEEFFNRIEAGVTYANRRAGATTGAWPGINPFGGWKASGSSGRGTGGPYYVQQFMREQSRVVIEE